MVSGICFWKSKSARASSHDRAGEELAAMADHSVAVVVFDGIDSAGSVQA
jgi:hypothetical protein